MISRKILFFAKQDVKDFFAVLGLLCLSGNIAANRFYDQLLVSFTLLIVFLCWRQRKHLMSYRFVFVLCIYLSIIIIQSFQFSFFPIVTYAGFLVRLFAAYIVIVYVKHFINTYVRVMVVLAGLGLFFQLPIWLGLGIPSFLYALNSPFGYSEEVGRLTVFIHTYICGTLESAIDRSNSGMFSEPGLFAGYLNLAILFLGVIRGKLSRKEYQISFVLLLVGLLSTMSTQGYIVLPFALFFHLDRKNANATYRNSLTTKRIYPVIVVCLILLGGYAYHKVPFLKDKIEQQYDVVTREERGWESLRLSGFIISWSYIKQKPLVGWGFHNSTRYKLTPWYAETGAGTTGMTDYIAKVGMLGFITYIVAALSSCQGVFNRSKLKTIMFFLFLLLVIQGEPFLGYPIFFSLMFIKPEILHVQKLEPTGV